MGNSLYFLRVKSAIAESGKAIAIALLILCVLSGTVFSTGVITPASEYSPLTLLSDDSTQPAPETEHLVRQATNVDAVVTDSTAAYAEGQQLRNEHAYPLHGVETVTVTGVGQGANATITHQRLLIRHQATLPGEDSPFWTDTTLLAEQDVGNSTDGAAVRLTGTVNATELTQRKETLEEDFGGDVTVQTHLVLRTNYDYEHQGTLASESDNRIVSQTADLSSKISFSDRLFVLPNEGDSTSVTSGGVQGTAPSSGGWLDILLAFLTIGGGAGAVYSFVGARRFDPEKVSFQLDQARHDEWVTVIDRFEVTTATTTSSVRSLRDLVDMAIDKHDRVVYCCTAQKYFFVDGDVQYEYAPRFTPSYADAFNRRDTDERSDDSDEMDDGEPEDSTGEDVIDTDTGTDTNTDTGSDAQTQSEEDGDDE